MKVVVYTAIIGGTDSLKPPRTSQSAPLIAFSGHRTSCRGWETRVVKPEDLPPDLPGHATTISRWLKLLPHRHFPDADYWIWTDATNVIQKDLAAMVPFDEDWVGYGHPHGRDLWKELDAIIKHKRDTVGNVERLRDRYRKLGVPRGLTMAPCGLIWRRNTEAMREFNERWFAEFVACETRRDMPAWGYCNWRKPIRARLMMGNNTRNEWVQWKPHAKRVPSVF